MPKYKLTYFNGPARAEVIRLTLVAGEADWEDVRLTFQEWGPMRDRLTTTPSTPFRFPWLPQLEITDENIVISQSLVALRFLARRFGLDGGNDVERIMVESIVEIYSDLFRAYIPLMFSKEPEEVVKKFEESLQKYGSQLEIILKNNKSSSYFVGEKLTVADITIYSVLREASKMLEEKAKVSLDWSKLPVLKAHHEKIAKEPKIHAYYSKSP